MHCCRPQWRRASPATNAEAAHEARRVCDPCQVTFRVARLLSAGRMVISERCHPRDEAEYEGMARPRAQMHRAMPTGAAAAFESGCSLDRPRELMRGHEWAQPAASAGKRSARPKQCAYLLACCFFCAKVLFADNISHIISLHSHFVATDEWREQARHAAALFRRRFAPHMLFQRAGIYRSFQLSMNRSRRRSATSEAPS